MTAVNDFIEANNAFDGDGMIAAFAPDALVNDNHREFWGAESIRRWIDKEIVGDKVTMDVVETKVHHSVHVVRAKVDGLFDRTTLPDPLVLTYYFTLTGSGSGDRIGTLFVAAAGPGY
jgi:hypothetical protein